MYKKNINWREIKQKYNFSLVKIFDKENWNASYELKIENKKTGQSFLLGSIFWPPEPKELFESFKEEIEEESVPYLMIAAIKAKHQNYKNAKYFFEQELGYKNFIYYEFWGTLQNLNDWEEEEYKEKPDLAENWLSYMQWLAEHGIPARKELK